jgi:hypothetical protein
MTASRTIAATMLILVLLAPLTSLAQQDFSLSTNLVNSLAGPTNQYIGTGNMTNGDTYQTLVNKANANTWLLWNAHLADAAAISNLATLATFTNAVSAPFVLLTPYYVTHSTNSTFGCPAGLTAFGTDGSNWYQQWSIGTNTWRRQPLPTNTW